MTYAQEKQLVTAEQFVDRIDSIITALGGTPETLELSASALRSEASYKHQITGELFQNKMNQLVTALGGTPEPIVPTEGNGYAATHGFIDGATFETKMAEVADNASGGGGSGTIDITSNGTFDVSEYATANVNVSPSWQFDLTIMNNAATPSSGFTFSYVYPSTGELRTVNVKKGESKTIPFSWGSDGHGYNVVQGMLHCVQNLVEGYTNTITVKKTGGEFPGTIQKLALSGGRGTLLWLKSGNDDGEIKHATMTIAAS